MQIAREYNEKNDHSVDKNFSKEVLREWAVSLLLFITQLDKEIFFPRTLPVWIQKSF